MNTSTSQPIRRSARLAQGHSKNGLAKTVHVRVQAFLPEKSVAASLRDAVPIKTRHSRRLALRQRPNYSEPEEWEVEDPIYTSNTDMRSINDLPSQLRTKCLEETSRVKKAMERVDNHITLEEKHSAVIDIFFWSRMSEFLIPMFPKYRATMRAKIQEFDVVFSSGNCTSLSDEHYVRLEEEMTQMKEAVANAHRSPYYVAVEA